MTKDAIYFLIVIIVFTTLLIGLDVYIRYDIVAECENFMKLTVESSVKNTYITSDNIKLFDRVEASSVFLNMLKENFTFNDQLSSIEPNARIQKAEIIEFTLFDESNITFPYTHIDSGEVFNDPFGHARIRFTIRSIYETYSFILHMDVSVQELE